MGMLLGEEDFLAVSVRHYKGKTLARRLRWCTAEQPADPSTIAFRRLASTPPPSP